MKVDELDITQWQDLWDECRSLNVLNSSVQPCALRCENSQLTVGWRSGGFTINGFYYKAFCPRSVFGPCAMLAVREDFLKWVTKRLKEIDELHDEETKHQETKQGELGL